MKLQVNKAKWDSVRVPLSAGIDANYISGLELASVLYIYCTSATGCCAYKTVRLPQLLVFTPALFFYLMRCCCITRVKGPCMSSGNYFQLP